MKKLVELLVGHDLGRNLRIPKPVKYLLIGIAALLALAIWPYRLVASPNSKIRIVDESGRPLGGVRVVRVWDTSERQKGESEAVSDYQGMVSFPEQVSHMSMLKRITRPLLILVPSPCGPEWEVYGHSEFRIFWPSGYALKFDADKWKRVSEVWQNQDEVCIRDPAIEHYDPSGEYVEIYFFNKRRDFDYTLTVYKAEK